MLEQTSLEEGFLVLITGHTTLVSGQLPATMDGSEKEESM